jgi:RNAse (barnase) inhibitor barstar
MRTLEINGQEFDSLEGFYKSLESYLMEGECPWGQNLDSLDEIISCNLNYTDNEENDVKRIIWTDFQKSKNVINEKRGDKSVIEIIEEILKSNDRIEFIKR